MNVRRRKPRFFKKRRYIKKSPIFKRRLFSKFIRRTAIKPELKYIETASTATNIGFQIGSTGQFYTQGLSPLLLTRGTGVGNRIGNRVNFVKVDYRMYILDTSNQTAPANAPTYTTYPVRILIWTPRRPLTESAAHVQGLQPQSNVDFNYVTVYKDWVTQMGVSYLGEQPTNAPGGVMASTKVFKGSVKFPRKVHLESTDDDLDPQKDILYYTVLINQISHAGATMYTNGKLWYFDS